MSALVNSIDQQHLSSLYQRGENNHIQFGWNNKSIEEEIVQLNFQLVRTSDLNQHNKLKSILKELLVKLPENSIYRDKLFRLACYTRDIIDGKGEYNLFYMQLCIWYSYNPNMGALLLQKMTRLTDINNKHIHPLGSWKDIKYLINYARDYYSTTDTPIINHAIQHIVNQIYVDVHNVIQCPNNVSLAAKWCPREKSKKFGWIFDKIACIYYSNYMTTSNYYSKEQAIKKCKMHFRKTLTYINNHIDTLEIKQCNNLWHKIDHSKIPSIAMNKQKISLQNLTKSGKQRSISSDRITCADNFKQYIDDVKNGIKTIKGKRVSLYDFVKDAIQHTEQNIIDVINLQWNVNKSVNNNLGNIIAMVDTSGSMEADNYKPLYNAIGLGIRVAELSKLGKRVITFSSHPTWVNLEDCNSFCECVNRVKIANWGCNTDFYKALSLILDTIVAHRLKPEDVENMTLAIFSDMQIDNASDNTLDMYSKINKLYADTGIKLWNKPFTTPHILFWNLRSTNGFPTMSTTTNTTMMSGYSPILLNEFCNKGIDALKNYTPYKQLCESLDNSRYSSN